MAAMTSARRLLQQHPSALCDILYKRLRNTLTYLLTYLSVGCPVARRARVTSYALPFLIHSTFVFATIIFENAIRFVFGHMCIDENTINTMLPTVYSTTV